MTVHKEKERVSHKEIATRLRHIADDIEKGIITVGEVQFTMPEQAEFDLEVESGKLEIEIEWGGDSQYR